jgi:hypothetical protein
VLPLGRERLRVPHRAIDPVAELVPGRDAGRLDEDIDRIGLPVKSIGRTCGISSAASAASPPRRSISSSPTIPQAM